VVVVRHQNPLINCYELAGPGDSSGVGVHLFARLVREIYPRLEGISILGLFFQIMNEEVDPTTPFCLGCGAWIKAADEMNVSPWGYWTFS